ncbi:proline-rich basic protein 1 [Molossus molossus]|uniref:Proline rich basic protein 1 n=1 Tax=Molossus molossus TaxID=27622 RepID=A0A7J8IBR2_MOLMO|nr:proline-rich basic protein 1 [Molossus molossus]KAF6481635.1 proline rich basic protein 1 [Molossus molossus]
MLIALAPPALPGLTGQLPSAPARRQDSSGSSGSYHTAPSSPEPPDVGPDVEGRANWPRVAPALGAGAQPRLSVSAQNSRQQLQPSSGFPRGPGSGPRPPQPQLRMLPSGEMEVIFGAGALFSPSDSADREVQQLTARAFHSPSPRVSPAPAAPQPQASDGGSRWATYLELRPRGPSPVTPAQFECVEVALEERAAPARPRTVPKRQIELRPRPRSPPREAGAPHPRLLLRTGSLDESLGRLQAAAGLVQTVLARKLNPETPAPSSSTFGPREQPEPETRKVAPSTRLVQEDGRSRPPRVHYSSASARVPRPWPSLRERAIRRDKPAPGTEPLGPVSSSIFLQSGEKTQEGHNQELKTRFPGETPERTVLRPQSPPFESRDPWEVPSKAVKPRSPSPLWQAPNGTVQGSHCLAPQNLSQWNRANRRVSSPSFPEASSPWENQDPTVEKTVSRRSPSPPTLSQWNPGVAKAGSQSPEAHSLWEVPHPSIGATVEGSRSPSPPALSAWEAPDRPVGTWSPSPQETWDSKMQGSSIVSTQEVLNGIVQGELAPPIPSAPRPSELTEAQSPPTRDLPNLAFQDSQPSPEVAAPELPLSRLVGTMDLDARGEALGPGEAASGRPRVAIPRPCDMRKMVKTTYAPSFPAGTTGSGLPAPSADPHREEGDVSKMQEPQGLETPTPAHYTSVYLKDFLPVVSHPYEPPEPSPNTNPPEASQPNGVLRRRAENSTAKPFARTEIRLPGVLALGLGLKGTRGVSVRGPGGENRVTEAQRLVPDSEGPTRPLGGARSLPQRSSLGPAGAQPTGPPRSSSPQAHPSSSPGRTPKLETPPSAPEPATAVQSPLLREPQALAGRMAPPQPRAASAPPMERPPEGPSQGARRPPGAAHTGKVLVDPESGRYYFVEAPRQPRLRLLFDPESGQYVEVLLPPSPPGPPRRIYTPLALNPGLYPPAYGPIPGLSLPPSPGPPAFSGTQPPWASEAGSLDGMYYLPVSGTPSPAPPLLLCAPPTSLGPVQPGKGSLFPV